MYDVMQGKGKNEMQQPCGLHVHTRKKIKTLPRYSTTDVAQCKKKRKGKNKSSEKKTMVNQYLSLLLWVHAVIE